MDENELVDEMKKFEKSNRKHQPKVMTRVHREKVDFMGIKIEYGVDERGHWFIQIDNSENASSANSENALKAEMKTKIIQAIEKELN